MAAEERIARIDYGDPLAPPGTPAWAKRWALEAAVKIPCIELEPLNVSSHIEHGARYQAWTLLTGPNGKPFDSFDEFCEAPKPFGCAFPAAKVKRILAALHGSFAMPFAATAQSTPTHAEAAAEQVLPGRKGFKAKEKKTSDASVVQRTAQRSGGATDYLAARIARDAPEVHERMKAGEFKSVRAAAVAAGLVKPMDPVKRAAGALKRVPEERMGEVVIALRTTIRRLPQVIKEQLLEWLQDELGRAKE